MPISIRDVRWAISSRTSPNCKLYSSPYCKGLQVWSYMSPLWVTSVSIGKLIYRRDQFMSSKRLRLCTDKIGALRQAYMLSAMSISTGKLFASPDYEAVMLWGLHTLYYNISYMIFNMHETGIDSQSPLPDIKVQLYLYNISRVASSISLKILNYLWRMHSAFGLEMPAGSLAA